MTCLQNGLKLQHASNRVLAAPAVAHSGDDVVAAGDAGSISGAHYCVHRIELAG
jgi:hypothetical protein